LDDLVKLGAIYGVFFFIQSSGYAQGAGLARSRSLHEAVTDGMDHLGHVFLPWQKTAWPLAPFLCGLLLLYAPYLPAQLQDPTSARANTWFLAIVVGATLFPFLGHVVNYRTVDRSAKQKETLGRRLGLAGRYALGVVGLTVVSFALLDWLSVGTSEAGQHWLEILTALIIAWLMFAAYVGSVFDGKLDRKTGSISRRPGDNQFGS
jgi:hypothetical protein